MKARWTRFAKCSWFFLIPALAATSAFGQTPADPAGPNLEILKLHWEKQIKLPRNFDPAPATGTGGFVDPTARTSVYTGTGSAADVTRPAVSGNRTHSLPGVAFPTVPGRLPIFYNYSMKVKNNSVKVIEGIAWDYTFIDPKSDKEIGRHQFLSYSRIPTNQGSTMRAELRSPPVRVVPSPASSQSEHQKLTGRALIQCVLYADDSVWKSPQAREGVCDLLRSNKPSAKRKHVA